MDGRVCLTCEYFHQQEAFGECGNVHIRCRLGSGGQCRRHPPVARLTYQGTHDEHRPGIWPIVYASGWCGHYRPGTRPFASPSTAAATRTPAGTVAERT